MEGVYMQKDFKTNVTTYLCSAGLMVNFPKFYGYSHMTFEPLKNSYQSFQISLEFKV